MAFPWLALGMNMGSSLLSFGGDKAQAKAAKAFQAYRNTMTKLSDAINQNAITTNEIFSDTQFVRKAVEIKHDKLMAEGQTIVSAGAAGVKGRSVNQSLFDVKRAMTVAESVRKEDLVASWAAFDEQRTQSAMSAALQQDHSYIPQPKLGSYLLGAAFKTGANYFMSQGK